MLQYAKFRIIFYLGEIELISPKISHCFLYKIFFKVDFKYFCRQSSSRAIDRSGDWVTAFTRTSRVFLQFFSFLLLLSPNNLKLMGFPASKLMERLGMLQLH